jgi:magnesium chelatase subunit I
VTGRIELVYEGEQEGPVIVANRLIGRAIAKVFGRFFPPVYTKRERRRPAQRRGAAGDEPDAGREPERVTPPAYREIIDFFASGGTVDLSDEMAAGAYAEALESVPGLAALVHRTLGMQSRAEGALAMEWVLESLAQASLIARRNLDGGVRFSDMLANMLNEGGS